jgi:HD-GYP domain-containing protein (c-di-GMP phosphodiesterase class II)
MILVPVIQITNAHESKILELTLEEKEWINSWISENKVIYVDIGNNVSEAFFYDLMNKDQLYGIATDILKEITLETGLNFKYIGHEILTIDNSENVPDNEKIYFGDTTSYATNLDTNIIGVYGDAYKCYVNDKSIKKIFDLDNKKVGFYERSVFLNIKEKYPELNIIPVYLSKEKKEENSVVAVITNERLNEYLFINTFDLPNFITKKGFIVNDDFQILAGIISKKVSQLIDNGILDEIKLSNREKYLKNGLKLSVIEKQWLLENKEIKFSATKNYPPFDIINSNGDYVGINKEYLDKVGSLLGVNIEFVDLNSINTINEVFNQLEAGDVHFATSITYTDERAEEFKLIELFKTNRITVIGNQNSKYVNKEFDLRNKTVALQKGTWIIEYLTDMNMNINIVETDSVESALRLVSNNKADYTVEKLVILNELLFEMDSTKYRLAGELDIEDTQCIAVSKKYPILANILKKVNEVIDYDQLISQKHVISARSKTAEIITLIVTLALILITLSIVLICVAKSITISVKRQKEDLGIKKKEYENMLFSIVDTLEEASMWNDSETGTHNKRVCYYCGFLARKYGLSDEMVMDIKKYASLHDIGKIGIKAQILKKPGKLTNIEFEEIKKHVSVGYNLIGRLSISDVAKNIIYYHHENYDGTGYANKLVGDDIPIEARIMSIADVYDALRTKRVYKKGFSHEEAVEIIIGEKGKKFDPTLVEIFETNNQVFELIFELNALDDERMI